MKPELFWYQNLTGGMNQATNFALVENNESELLKNVSLDKTGVWSVRNGTTKLGGTTAGGDSIWGLFSLNLASGTHTFFRVNNGDLEKFDGTDTWTATDTDEWTTSKKVNGVNFKDRLYLGCEDGTTPLAWVVAAGTLTDVVPTIGGHHLAVNKSILAVGGNNIKQNVIFYSDPYTDNFYSATGTCSANADSNGANTVVTTASILEADMIGAMLYNSTEGAMNFITDWTNATIPYVTTDASTATWDNDTVYVLQNNFTQDGKCTGITSFKENFVSFDEDNMYIWDPTSNYSEKLPGYGCVNERTVCVVGGYLIWANRDGLYLWNGEEIPVDIKGKITDPVDGYGLWNLINDTNWSSVAAGADDTKYYFSVGTLSTLSGAPASALANAEFVFDTQRDTWSVGSRDSRPVVYASYINTSGAKDLYYGEKDASAVYKMNTGTTDATDAGGTANISYEFRTPHIVPNDPTVEWRIEKYYVRYKSGGSVTLKQSIDFGTYATVDTLSASSTSTVVEVLPAADAQGHTVSLSFSGTSTLSLEAFGFVAVPISFGSHAT